MSETHITNIKKRDLLFYPGKYLWLQVNDEISNINFSMLLKFIDTYSDYGKDKEYGNAYYRIRKKANAIMGLGVYSPRKLKTSKQEIKSIRSTTVSKRDGKLYVKIPYKVSYIFKAIIMIIDEIKQENNIELPPELKHTINLTYRMAFYEKHIGTYDAYAERFIRGDRNEYGYGMKVELYNDFHAENSIFNTIVK